MCGRHHPLTVDDAFDLLADRQRRTVLVALLEESPLDVHGLFSDAARETDGGLLQVRHSHLPKLHRRGLIEWDREAGTVSRGPEFKAIRPVLEVCGAHDEKFPGGWP